MTLGDFSNQADAYNRSRPSYPVSIMDTLVTEASLSPNDSVVEFGAGTGIFTRLLLERNLQVTAIEPNEAMMRLADMPDVKWINGTFEDSTLQNESQSWAVAAQAFHWADPVTALPEIRRILKPRSVFTVLWNNRANRDCEVLKWTEQAIRRHVPDFDEAYRDKPWKTVLESTCDFTFLSKHVERHIVPMTVDRYLNLWRSHNRLNNIAGQDRFDAFCDELQDYLRSNSIEQIDLPYDCEAWSAQRVD